MNDVPLAILIKAIEQVLAIPVLIFTNPRRTVAGTDCRTSHRFAIDTRPGDSKSAFPVRTGGGAVDRAGPQNRNTGSAPINATDDTAKTYGDSSRDFHDALPPGLRTDLELVAVVEARPELRPVVRRAILELARDAARGC